MKDNPISTSIPEAGRRSLDLDISAVLIAERLVGEILGWDLVDWPVVEPHKGKKFFFGRQRRGEGAIHDQLKPLFDRCAPDKNDFSALRPSPIVNANLSKLVGYLCRHVGRHGLIDDDMEGPALKRTKEQDHLHLVVAQYLLRRIGADPILEKRANCLKQIAAAAESELEKHFADLINQRLENGFLPNGKTDPFKVSSLREQAKQRVQETKALNERELVGLAMPALALDDEALIRIEMAKILLSRFPYVRNYELMLYAELAMLQQPLTPRLLRERSLAGEPGMIDRALLERWDQAVRALSSMLDRSEACPWQGVSSKHTIAICGSGPLPLSALFLHLLTGANIVLIDDHEGAVERSRRLIGNLERLGILVPDALRVHQRNAGQVWFRTADRPGAPSSEDSIVCDAVMIASLVDQDAKISIAAQFSGNRGTPELLIMRSATGLSAKIAYDPVPTAMFGRGYLAYSGETVPATQVATHLDRVEAAQRHVACTTTPDLLAIAHPDVVNTTEVYRKISINGKTAEVDFGACETVEDAIRQLDIVVGKLKADESKT